MTSFAITSCSSGPVRELFMMPAPAAYEEAPAPFGIGADSGGEAARLDILFATNRDPARDKDEDPFYTGERGYLVRVGEARIALGDGELSWDEARKISLLKSRPDDFPLYVEEATEFGIIPDSVSVFTPPDAAPEERQRRAGRFAQAINAQLARGAVNDVFIYVHGYKVTFENPLLVSAELWHFLGNEGAFVAFSWPATPSRLAYFKDIETARVSAWALRKLIDYIGRETKASRIHVIGYSAGTRVVLTALHEMALSHAGEPAAEVRASTRLGNVILIGSDVDTGMFAGQILDGVLNVQQGLTIYGSPTDKALKVSRTVFSHSRMGQLRPESLDGPMRDFVVANPELMLVDVSGAVDPDDDNGHGYFRKSPWVSSDILMTLRYGLGPGDRGLMRNEGSSVWRFPDDYLQRFEAALERVNPELARQRASRRLTAEKPAVGRRAQP
jgi:esterase/lipase superfamily enzyme